MNNFVILPTIYIAGIRGDGGIMFNEIEYKTVYLIAAESIGDAKKIANERGIKYDDIFLHSAHDASADNSIAENGICTEIDGLTPVSWRGMENPYWDDIRRSIK